MVAEALSGTTSDSSSTLTPGQNSPPPLLSSDSSDIEKSKQSPDISDDGRTLDEKSNAIPDGGILAWLQVLGAFFVYFNSWGLVNTFGTFVTYYIQVLPQSPSQIAWIGTFQGFLLVSVGIITGTLNDRGYFRPLLAGGTFLVVFGLMMTSLCTEYYQLFLAQGLCIGLGAACIFLPSLVVVATYFDKKRAFATGVTAAGGQLGGVVYPIVFRQLIDRLGFGWTVRVIGFIAVGMLVFTNAVMKPRVPPTHGQKLVDLSALRDAPFMLFAFGLFVTFTGLFQFLYYAPTYGQAVLGMSLNSSFYLTAIINGTAIAGCILPSILADFVGPLNLIVPATFLTAVLAFAWIGVDSVTGLQVLCAFYGFLTGILTSLPNPIIVGLTPTLDRVGVRVGMCYTVAAFGLLIGSPLGGLMINEETGYFLDTQIFGGCFLLGGGVIFSFVWFMQYRHKKRCF